MSNTSDIPGNSSSTPDSDSDSGSSFHTFDGDRGCENPCCARDPSEFEVPTAEEDQGMVDFPESSLFPCPRPRAYAHYQPSFRRPTRDLENTSPKRVEVLGELR